MHITRRHAIIDGIFVAAVVAASFGSFFYVMAQTAILPEKCMQAGITDSASCEKFIREQQTTTSATTTNTQPAAACVDSDGGKTYDRAGGVSFSGGTFPDRCLNDTTLEEQYCDSTTRSSETHTCDAGLVCKSGACVPPSVVPPAATNDANANTNTAAAPAAKPPVCTDSDNGRDYAVRGTMFDGVSPHSDSCDGATKVIEFYCDASMMPRVENATCPEKTVCREGACVPAPVDTTNTNTAAAQTNARTDVNLNPTANTNTNAAGTDARTNPVVPPPANANTNAAATPAPETSKPETKPTISCTDSDGGKVPEQRGVVAIGTSNFTDRCISADTLEENFCDGQARAVTNLACGKDKVCKEGACVAAAVTPAAPKAAVCGNQLCETALGETRENCAKDCASAPATNVSAQICGNGVCEDKLGETSVSCPKDCAAAAAIDAAKTAEEAKPTESKTEAPKLILPQFCVLKGISTMDECRKAMAVIVQTEKTEASADAFVSPTSTDIVKRDAGIDSFLPKACTEKGLTDANACAELVAKTTAAGGNEPTLPAECSRAGANTKEACEKYLREKSLLPACVKAGATTQEQCAALLAAKSMPAACTEKGIVDEASCKALIASTYLPDFCTTQGITDASVCKEKLLAKYGSPKECQGLDAAACWRLIDTGGVDKDSTARIAAASASDLSETCKKLGAKTVAECETLRKKELIPEECRVASVFTAAGCEKYLFAKAQHDTVETAALPKACTDAGITDAEKCKTLLVSNSFPQACVDAGIAEPDACRRYIALRDLPKECSDAGVQTKAECEALLRKKYLDPICASQGITDTEACKQFALSRAASGVACAGLSAEECAVTIKDRHLGEVLEANQRVGDTEGKLKGATGKDGTIDLAKLRADGADQSLGDAVDVLPLNLNGDRRFRVLDSAPQIGVGDDDVLKASAGSLITYDTDGDGVPDDVEKRRGTDPTKADTDGNGVGDKEELLRGRTKLAAIEKAILEGKQIGQPISEGVTDEKLTVELTADAGNADDAKLDFNGTGTPGDVVTLYVYSELPVVVTTNVDANGQWSYEFDDSLKDGDHEVYVVVNDDTGKVVTKSNPLAFVVQGAVAATSADVASEETKPVEVSPLVEAQSAPQADLRLFIVAGVILVLLALGLVAAIVMKKPKDPTTQL